MSAEPAGRPRSPWSFVPGLYVLQGAHYFLVDTALSTFMTSMGLAPKAISHSSALVTLPWTLKALWSPLVDLFGTKRRWLIAAELGVLAGALMLSAAPERSGWFAWTIAACTWIALFAATADVATDGFYMLALGKEAQAGFVGVRNTCFRLGRIVVAGGTGELAGGWIQDGVPRPEAWSRAFLCAAAGYGLLLLASALLLPRPAGDRAVPRANGGAIGGADGVRGPRFLELLADWFRQPRVVAVLAFLFLYRLGESLLAPMIAPFLQMSHAEGGLGLSERDFARAYSTWGVVALLAGGLAGGALLARKGLPRLLWPMALAMHAPNVLFLWAAHAQPEQSTVYAIVAVEQLAYGFGFSAYMVFLLEIARRSSAPTAHYAVSTGLMGLAHMVRFWSGDLVEAFGFATFLAIVCLAALPGLLVLPFVPLAARTERTAP